MLNLLDDERVEGFYQRLNVQLRKMPLEQRAEVHQELRQHLEALVAAHEELGATPQEAVAAALRQFGDPRRIGRRLARDWSRGAHWPRNRGAFAFTYAYVCFGGALAALAAAACLWGVVATVGDLWLAQWTPFESTFFFSIGSIAPAAAGWLTGRRTGQRAVPAMAGAVCAIAAPLWLLGLLTSGSGHGQSGGPQGLCLMTCCWMSIGTLSAYASSARALGRRYRLRFVGLKLP